jgi:hypothetical protein
VPIPKVPDLAPTTETVHATAIVIGDRPPPPGTRGHPVLTGVVQSSQPRSRSFYVVAANGELVGVTARRVTRYSPATHSTRPFRAVRRGERVTVYGSTGPGTLDRKTIADLRSFLRKHGVGAVLVELGRDDSATVVAWVTDALGRPSSDRGGGALWLGVQARLRG